MALPRSKSQAKPRQAKPSQAKPSQVVCRQMMIRIMIIEMLIMTMLRPNFHMRQQPSLFGLTSQTCEKFACQVGITASQTYESWPKTTHGHTHTHTHTDCSHTSCLGMAGILQIPSHSSCGSRDAAAFTLLRFGANRQNLATATGDRSAAPPAPSPSRTPY